MNIQKRILLLGGSAQQIVAIETAKRLGYYTILCDYLPDNPGQDHADRFYQVSTTDKQAILDVAVRENINGIIAYASDPAAPTAAYVAEKLGLPTNPYNSVDILCNKDKFRVFLSENGFHAPRSSGYATKEELLADISKYTLPVIVKPVDSSGSKGTTVLHSWDRIGEAYDFAVSYSRSHRVITEEFICKKHPYLIGGDIFVVDGKIVLWGLMNCHRDENANPLVPVGKSYPAQLSANDMDAVKKTLQDMIDKLHIRMGALNVELVVDKAGNVCPIDIGPRNGGNMIPDLLGLIFGVDVVEMSVSTAMGEPRVPSIGSGNQFLATHNLHAIENGKYQDVLFSDELESHIIRKCLYKKQGDPVAFFDNAAKALGIIFLKFDSENEMFDMLGNISKHIHIVLEK